MSIVRGGLHAQPARASGGNISRASEAATSIADLLSPLAQAQLATTEPLEDEAYRQRQSCCLDRVCLVKTWKPERGFR